MFFGAKDKIELKVTGMTCGHCEAKIEEAVSKLPGVKKVAASRTRQTVTIEPDESDSLNLQTVKETIESLGYQVTE
ncbi:MAG: heavy-metal-associated domain-containing protein [candidate division Zixibacteria bacterium]|nr:heavy-metal-associated domain-containing protein [candidate division Zixibacteria bacterium]MCI0596472.1 heavy-metal-associated domain-containing protein [candidate division Zixibacteria bacterium]